MLSGEKCVCKEGYYRSDKNTCDKIITCPDNSIFLEGKCVCISGYSMKDGLCVKQCPTNSFDNGLGKCICLEGYYELSPGVCLPGKPCPAFSTRDSTGKCVCFPGYIDYGTYCARCAEGLIWSEKDGKCILPCGQNEVPNQNNKCVCLPEYGKYEGKCQKCPGNYFIVEGYCVTCPIGTFLNSATNLCECNSGYAPNALGICE